MLADGALDAVLAWVGVQMVQLSRDDPAAPGALAGAVPGLVRCATYDGGRHELTVRDADAAVRALVTAQIPVHHGARDRGVDRGHAGRGDLGLPPR